MPLARCPDCDELVEITPNGADPATTFRRQRLAVHPDKKARRSSDRALCVGSGKDV